MLKDSMPTSEPNSERIPFPQNTSAFSQTQTGPLTLMVYFTTFVGYMSQTPRTFSLCSPIFITHSQEISLRQRYCTKSGNITTGPDFPFMSRTTANHVLSVLAPNPCTTNLMEFSSNF